MGIRRRPTRCSISSAWKYVIFTLCVDQVAGWPLEVGLDTNVSVDVDVDLGGKATSSPNAMPLPRIHEVVVGAADQPFFQPAFVNAAVGEVVRFSFRPGNHTLTESTFMSPCSSRGAFDTNFFHARPNGGPESDVTIMVESDNPRWFFCRQSASTSHCGEGMVFGINPGRYWYSFYDRAMNSTTAKTWSSSWMATNSASSTALLYKPQTVFGGLANPGDSATTDSSQPYGQPMTMTIATITSTLAPDTAWSTQTITTSFQVPRETRS